jgi:Family of unknown function (DUF6492)
MNCLSEPQPTKEEDRSFAMVTKSYLPDLKRCELLSESLDHCAPNVSHYLIVDKHDWSAFRHLQSGRRRLIESEALLKGWMLRLPGRTGLWLSLSAPPVRGWIMQQILKIAAMEAIPERTLVFCDSDTAFFRSFDRDDFLVDGKMGLIDLDFDNRDTRLWTVTARRLLGVSSDKTGFGYRNHVGYVVGWNRETVKAMQQRIESTTGLSWQVALARTLNFSEYMLYGTFVREVLGYSRVDHAPSTVPLVKGAWGATTDSTIAELFASFDPRTLAVMVHSKDNIDPSRYRAHLERFWRLNKTNV